ncbi:MAG: NADH-quinone oxidoreductase subunit C, partial [Chloroflexota bacterium]
TMTKALSGAEVAQRITEKLPNTVIETSDDTVFVKSEALRDIASFLKSDPGLAFDFLNNVTAVDHFQANYFDLFYQITSLAKNQSLTLKIRCSGRDNPAVPSVTPVWKGADLQEREVYDLMGISFSGHPNMKRILLWDGFPGHPLRKDFIQSAQPPEIRESE